MDLAFSTCQPPFSSLLSLFFCFLHICMYVSLHKQHSCHMLGCGSAGKFYFLSLLVNQLAPWIQCVFHGNNKVHRANEALKQLGLAFFVLLRARCSQFVNFFTTAADLLQVTIAFVLKIFSFSNKKKSSFDAFDRHCWDAACCSRMSEVWDFRCSWLAVKWCSAFPLISWLYV